MLLNDVRFINLIYVFSQFAMNALADPVTQAKINEAISDVAEPNVKMRYWPLTVLFGRPESEEGLKEAEDTLQAGTSFI